jgi:3-deoxy-D-manno-octulosonic-acid transferase/heptosyltransferase-1
MEKFFNFDYFNILKEIPLFCLISIIIRKEKINFHKGRILIVNPCLIGEFASSVPAIADFVQRNKDKKIDLIVSTPLKILAERIIGINKVYIAHSVFKRPSELFDYNSQIPSDYEEIILLRASVGVYNFLKKVSTHSIKTGAQMFSRYALHLLISLVLGRTPKQWRIVNFEMLGGIPRNIPFGEIFKFGPEDCENINTLLAVRSHNKKIIIHTGASWRMMRWEREKWVNLLQGIHVLGFFEFIFIGAGEDIEDYEYISSRLKFKVHSVISQINLLELMLLLNLADYFIGVDSGPANLAHLVNLRSIVIFGPGPHMYMPSNPNDVIIDKSNGRGLYQRFFFKKNGFIQRISTEEVYQAFYNLQLK